MVRAKARCASASKGHTTIVTSSCRPLLAACSGLKTAINFRDFSTFRRWRFCIVCVCALRGACGLLRQNALPAERVRRSFNFKETFT